MTKKTINDGERLYYLSQKTFKLLTTISDERKASKKLFDDNLLTKQEHHQNISYLYLKLVFDLRKLNDEEIADVVSTGIMDAAPEALDNLVGNKVKKGFINCIEVTEEDVKASEGEPIVLSVPVVLDSKGNKFEPKFKHQFNKKEVVEQGIVQKGFAGLKDFKVNV